ncbi:MAG: metal ABC transporter substrate-binding protein [bacterium]
MKKLFFSFMIWLFLAGSAFAELNIVVTLPWIGSVVKEIGKDKIKVIVLVKPNQDAHYIEAKPSMIISVRKADILMYNGLDLEIGYLPLLIQSSNNPKIMPGKAGNFDCSKFVKVLEKNASVDRNMGDVHPLGNPHYLYSPSDVLRVAQGMTNLLSDVDSSNAAFYKANFKAFSEKMMEKERQWHALPINGKKYVAYHNYFAYLANEFGLIMVGYMEPKPGIPPSAAHIEELIETMKATKTDGILITPAYPIQYARSLSEKTDVKVIVLPNDVGSMPDTDNYFSFMDRVMESLQ